MAKCSALKASGERCKNLAATGREWCTAHDPAFAERRKRAASKAARSKGGGAELKELKQEVRELIGDVKSERVEKGAGSVALQGFNVLARLIDLERRIREQEDLAERLAQLEEAAAAPQGGVRRWG